MHVQPSSPREFIKQLCEKNYKNETAARCIDKDVQTSFISLGCFINEFVQNANDQATKSLAEISFTLIKNELIVSHKGKPFNESDVQAICDFANSDDNKKSDDDDKTGYKDIGFKSVFKVAYRVDIWSKEWHFHFDEKSDQWIRKENESPYAWQIAPLWTEERDLSIAAKKFIADQERTTFISQLKDPLAVENELRQFINNPEDILFLSKIKKVAFCLNDQNFIIVNKDFRITMNDMFFSEWKLENEKIVIPPEVKAFLKALKPSECPKRLQKEEFQEVTLGFCYQIQKDQIVSKQDSKLYCTLPTGVRAGFPFLLNAPFLLNPSREALLDNAWNIFLIQNVAKLNFAYFKTLLANKDRAAFKILAPDELIGVNDRLKKVFKEQMEQSLREAFLPPQTGNHRLSINKASVDTTGFYRMLDENQLILKETDQLVHPAIEPQEILKRFPQIKKITLEEIISRLHDLMRNKLEVQTCRHILSFFSEIFKSGNSFDPAHLQLFKKQPFILTTRGEVVSLNEVFLPPRDNEMPLPSCFPLHLIHPEVLNKKLILWLKSIEVKQLEEEKIVDTYAKDLNHQSLKIKKNNIEIIRLLFYLFKKSSNQKFESLKGILIYSISDQLIRANQAYFPSHYAPTFDLHQHVPNQSQMFISEDYPIEGKDIKSWKKFFLKLGVHENCDFKFSNKVGEIKKFPKCHIQSYLKFIFLESNPQRPVKDKKLSYKDSDTISSFACFPFIRLIKESRSFNEFFWQRLLKNQNEITEKYSKAIYHIVQTSIHKEQLTYLQYVFQNHELIPDKAGKFHRSKALYAPSLESTISVYFPTAYLPVVLSPKMEEFLGFRMTLEVNHCYKLLQALQRSYQHESYKLVMNHLLINMRKNELKNEILKIQWKFQAANNEWHGCQHLQLWAFPNSLPPSDSSQWIKPIFSVKEMEEFSSFFKIPSVSEHHDVSVFKNARQCEDLKNFIWQKIPEIAFYWARYRSFDQPVSFYIDFLIANIGKIKFMLVSEEDDDDDTMQMIMIDDSLYYFLDWQKKINLVGENLGKYLKFEDPEIAALKSALLRTRSYRNEDDRKKLDEFKTAFEIQAQQFSTESSPPPQYAVQSIPLTRPPESSKIVGSMEDVIEDAIEDNIIAKQVTPKKSLLKQPWSPQTPPSAPNSSPIKEEPAPNIGWQPSTTPGIINKKSLAPKSEKAISDEVEEGNHLSDLDKKRIGLWAEEHVLVKKIEEYKYNLREFDPEVEDLSNGIRRVTMKTNKMVIDLLWFNDPQLRPEDQKDNELWDSGQHYDIEIRKQKENGDKKIKKLEVKGTTAKRIHFFLQGQEWKTLLDDPSKYHIYAVTQVGTELAEVNHFKNLLEALKEHRLTPISSTEFKG